MARTFRSEPRAGGPVGTARLFVALDPPAEVREAIAERTRSACAGRDDLRLVPIEALHVTLAFLGHLLESLIPPVWSTVVAGASGSNAPLLDPRGVRALPPGRPRLLALDLADTGGACALHDGVARELAAAALYEPEQRPFWPHVTLARVRRGGRAEPIDLRGGLEPFRAREVTLYRSRLSPAGPRYEPLERLRLGG